LDFGHIFSFGMRSARDSARVLYYLSRDCLLSNYLVSEEIS
jgi:hypothetical protein